MADCLGPGHRHHPGTRFRSATPAGRIAYALDAPVKLSVGTLRARRWLPALPGRAAERDLDMRRVVAYLQGSVPGSTLAPAGLAVVAVDNAPVVARAVAALAASCAGQGHQVVAADLSRGAHMAHLLGVKSLEPTRSAGTARTL